MARFFINRPIVAMVISIVTVLLGFVAMSGLPIAQYPEIVPPMVQVTTTFVGASATDVEASVATPIEQKVNGVENSIYMKSTNANDGTMTLKVSFDVGSNLDMANVLTQNKLSEAMPQLPASVKTYGVAVKKALAFPLLVISIKSPNGTYDNNFLSNYTTINIQDNLARIKGVGPDQPVRRQRLRDARLAAARPDCPARDHGARHRERHLAAEHAVAVGPVRRASRPRRARSSPTPSARRGAC